MTLYSNHLAKCAAVTFLFGCALSSSAEKVTQPINVFDLFKKGDVEYHMGPQKDLTDTPAEIFKMSDGLFHISGRGYGYMATKQDFDNYHLVIEFKWGAKTWGNRKEHARDNGILYHATGPHGALAKTWPACYEANIIEGGMGDFLVLGCTAPDGTPLEYSAVCEYVLDRDKERCWKKGQPRRKVPRGRVNWEKRDVDWTETLNFRGRDDIDAPIGEWNRLEVIARGNTTVHIFNGKVVNEAFELSPWSGKICIQTDGAEMFVRRYDLLPLDTFCEPWPPVAPETSNK